MTWGHWPPLLVAVLGARFPGLIGGAAGQTGLHTLQPGQGNRWSGLMVQCGDPSITVPGVRSPPPPASLPGGPPPPASLSRGPVSPSPESLSWGSGLPLPSIIVPGVLSPPPQHHCPGGPVSPSPSITVLGVLSSPPPASLSWGSWSAPDHPRPPPASLLGGLSPQGCRVGVCAVVSGRVFFPRAVESQGLAGRQEASSGSHGAHCLLRVRSLGLESTFRREHSESQFH